MCGILGILWNNSEAVPDQTRLDQTARLLEHRGPDGHGTFAEPGVAFVHTRLSLVDLNERSNQPFWDPTGRYAMIYNGEVYNFRELRATLEQEGAQFRTTSDTEVMLEALIRWGPGKALPQFEGMFAFAFYDRQEQALLLARDRFGIKPLFIYEDNGTLVFASEIRAMAPWIKLEPDYISISSYLQSFAGPHTGRTFYKNVRSLEPGGTLTLRRGLTSETGRFFALTDFLDPAEAERLAAAKESDLIDQLDEMLNASVKQQLLADAPVGGLCSGGVDSSVVLAVAKRYHNNLAIFHANVVGQYSEHEAAETLAKHLKLDLKSVEVRSDDFVNEIVNVTRHYGHPFYRTPHSVPFLKVSRLVRQNGVKAVVTGEGSDECFLGYSHMAPNVRAEWRVRPILRRVKRALLGSNGSNGHKPFRYLSSNDILGGDINSDSGFVTALHNRFETVGEALEIRSRLKQLYGDKEPAGVLTALDHFGYSLRALLHRDDSMGMSASIEARFPFLDSNIVRFGLNIPYRTKLRFSTSARRDPVHPFYYDKWILRQVAKRYLPDSLSQREKKPFPVIAYHPGYFEVKPQFLKNSFVRQMFGLTDRELDHLVNHASHDLKWKMFQLEVWVETCLMGQPGDAVMQRLQPNLSVLRVA